MQRKGRSPKDQRYCDIVILICFKLEVV